MNTFDTNEWMRLTTCERSRLYYHTHKNYRKNKNKNDNERNKKRYSEDPEYRKYSNEKSHLYRLKKKLGETSGNISSFISIK